MTQEQAATYRKCKAGRVVLELLKKHFGNDADAIEFMRAHAGMTIVIPTSLYLDERKVQSNPAWLD
jgi:hypothetical protein